MNSRLRECLAQMPAYLSVFGTDGRIVWLSATGFGVDPSALLGRPSDTLIPEADRPRWRSYLHRVVHQRELVRYTVDVDVPAPPGRVRLTGRLAPVIIAGRVAYVACACTDATYRPAEACEGCHLAQPAGSPAPAQTPEPGRPPGALWLSPLERRIVAALAGRGWTPARELCVLAGESDTGDFRAVARNLVERLVLESAPSRGYRLVNPPQGGDGRAR